VWICGNDFFLSVVSKDCARDELMIRARRKGDIEKIFPGAKVSRYTKSDYLYRAPVKREAVKAALCGEVDRITYDNFKSSVADKALHDSYLRVWTEMAKLQEVPPYSGGNSMPFWEDFIDPDVLKVIKAPTKKHDAQVRKNLKKLTRGQ
jgi:hypothetical protein